MKILNKYSFGFIALLLLVLLSCEKNLDELALNRTFNEEIDYSISDNMVLPLIGAYAEFYSRGWETIPLIAVRGDDVNAGGLGDQQDFDATDHYVYNKDYWMYNSLWQLNFNDIYTGKTAIEQIERYREAGASAALADQYIAEVNTLNAFLLFHLSRVWGAMLIPKSSDPADLLVADLSSKDEVMQYIVDQMDAAIPDLSTVHPADRTDVPGGVNRYTALAIKAMAEQELGNYQAVAAATSEIINSGAYQLEPDFYELFKLQGKLNRENILELQYSDYGQGSGASNFHLFAFYGPQSWTPAVAGISGGWGFFEPSFKFIKFMLDRSETVRLETTVLFTDRGINELKQDPKYAVLPDFVSNTTRDGDVFKDYARAKFASGKFYLPSNQVTPGRTDYGANKNYTCIRYAEILLMHAEAILQGASSSAISADQAVNLVRARAGMPTITGVTLQNVIDEKFAELATEWGVRYYDLVRWQKYDELSYDGRTFTTDKIFLPYPQNQVDQLPILKNP
ncbi:MAG: RagB/SusD family nutrient uptake outer membrane protein [Phaeodactylibacter sp.]|nr:RagB/SusD family nutrient uptake outer membrane protein [Phaeodactylibacter sp.]MCB9275425.1 RagB/SusD family nutrient uptake outer membrane protein [Lewinellaceae bacterium]